MNTLSMQNATAQPFAQVPVLDFDSFRKSIVEQSETQRVLAFFAMPEGEKHKLVAVFGDPKVHLLHVSSTIVEKEYPSLTPDVSALHWFEREIVEQFGVIPQGHPHLKPIRFHKDNKGNNPFAPNEEILPGVTDYLEMTGDAPHEVAVGPVHAGVIEPGHFRFQCMGETVYSLEIELGYQHRGIENMLIGGPHANSRFLLETASGDSSIANAINYALVCEALTNRHASASSARLRQIALELERLANHIGDMGALAGDVAFLPTQSFCGRIRGDVLNLTAEIAGNRFGRNLVIPGGNRLPLETQRAKKIHDKLLVIKKELMHALELMLNAPTALDRFENTGAVPTEQAKTVGLVGVAGRASGLNVDARVDFPHPNTEPLAVAKAQDGDVMSRILIRFQEIQTSCDWLIDALENIINDIPQTYPIQAKCLPNAVAVAVTEAWRGETVAVAITDENGNFRRFKVVDPSFHNWFGLALALRSEQISNFPICNKSFNLSYCGHDL